MRKLFSLLLLSYFISLPVFAKKENVKHIQPKHNRHVNNNVVVPVKKPLPVFAPTVFYTAPPCVETCCPPPICCPHFYIKPAYTISKREDDVFNHSTKGGALSIGFIQPWTQVFSWGLEARYGRYGRDTESLTETQSIDTVIQDISGTQNETITNQIFTTQQTTDYDAFDLTAVLYANCRNFAFFGKAGFATVHTHTTGSEFILVGFNQETVNITPTTTTTTTIDRAFVLEPVNTKITDTVPLIAVGLDYSFTPNIGAGLELSHFAGSTLVSPMNSLQLFVRLST